MTALRLKLRPIFGAGSRVAVLAAIAVLGSLAVILAYGIATSGGSQPAQLVGTPQPTLDLMPMGNAHIPTTNAPQAR